MFGFKFIQKISALLLFLSVSSIAVADPFTVTFTEVIDPGTTLAGINIGETYKVDMVLDNGGTTAASQTWDSTDIVSITISINDAPSTITTVLSPVVLSDNAGSFITNAAGVLTTSPTSWNDDAMLSTTVSSNDPAGTADLLWWINGGNNVYYHEDSSTGVYIENVGNIILPAFWTGPVSAMAPVPATATPVPTLSQWAIILLSLMLLAIGFVKTRRFS